MKTRYVGILVTIIGLIMITSSVGGIPLTFWQTGVIQITPSDSTVAVNTEVEFTFKSTMSSDDIFVSITKGDERTRIVSGEKLTPDSETFTANFTHKFTSIGEYEVSAYQVFDSSGYATGKTNITVNSDGIEGNSFLLIGGVISSFAGVFLMFRREVY